MANLFNITIPSNVLQLDAKRSGQITFTVANATARSLNATAQVVPSDPSIQSWFQIEQGAARHLDPNQTIQYVVTVQVPDTAPAQNYIFHLTVADQSNPDDNFSNSSDVRVTAPPPAPPAPKPFPWWIIAVAALVVVIIVIIIAAVTSSNQARANADATSTAAALNAATQTAVFFNQQTAVAATATASAVFATQTEQARPTPTLLPSPTLPRPPGIITVLNKGAFVVQFTVSYNFSGGFQNQTTGQFPVGANQTIVIPGDAFNISVLIQFNTVGSLSSACTFNFSPAQNKHYTVNGTIFGASCTEP